VCLINNRHHLLQACVADALLCTPWLIGIRDYIHVVDLARGHLAALQQIMQLASAAAASTDTTERYRIYNLGTGSGSSVLQVIAAMNRALGRELATEITDRRAGDVAILVADVSKAERELHWRAERSLDEMCRDAWNFQSNNPNGYPRDDDNNHHHNDNTTERSSSTRSSSSSSTSSSSRIDSAIA
jgi:nucleoside-diphosphate-sugar epimerase